MPSEYAKTIMKVFSPTLQLLELSLNGNINLQYLAICKQLESLNLPCPLHPSLKASNEGAFDAGNNFLPKLKSFESASCLGALSSLFEGKPNLIHLKLFAVT